MSIILTASFFSLRFEVPPSAQHIYVQQIKAIARLQEVAFVIVGM